jgi:hypothetical protein
MLHSLAIFAVRILEGQSSSVVFWLMRQWTRLWDERVLEAVGIGFSAGFASTPDSF